MIPRMLCHGLWLLIIFTTLLPTSVGAQSSNYPVNQWITELSAKKLSTTANSILNTIAELEYPENCNAIKTLYSRSRNANIRAQIRINHLYESVLRSKPTCHAAPSAIDLLNESLEMAYEIEDEMLIVESYRRLSDHYYNVRQERGPALMYMLVAMEEKEKIGEEHFTIMPYEWYELGGLQYHARDYRGALESLQKSLQHKGNAKIQHKDTLDDSYKMYAWNTIGLSHAKLNEYDEAFDAFDQASFYADKTDQSFWKGLIQGNRGDIFFRQGNLDSAEVLLKYDYEQSKDSIFDNAANSLQWLARIKALKGEPHQSLIMLREADQLLTKKPETGHRLNMHYTYALVYKSLGNADSAFYHYENYSRLHDSIEIEAARNQTDILRLRLDNRENVQKIVSLNKEKKKIQLVRNFIIALILLSALSGYLYLNRKRLKLKLQKREALDAKEKAETEAANAKAQLLGFTETLREKNMLVENLQTQLLNKELSEAQIEKINELSQYTILTDEDWERFKTLFNKVYPSFFIDLKRDVPDITISEQRMAALIKLQIPGKDAANMLGISPSSVRKSRQRLRQRLGLEAEEELETYFTKENTIS